MDNLSTALKPLSLIEAVASLPHSATLAELAANVGVPKPTVHRWLGALEAAGLLQRTLDGRRYELAAKAYDLAFSILTNRPNGVIRREILAGVVEAVGETCNLTVLDGSQVKYLDRVESNWPLRITFQPGSKVPAYCSASGKLFLALMQPAKRDILLRTTRLARLTENTIVDRRVLLKQLSEIKANGFALDQEEFVSGLVCIAVPIYQQKKRSRTCVAALAVQAPVARMAHADLVKKLPLLQNAAAELASTLLD